MPLSSSSSSSGQPRRGLFSSSTSDEHTDDLLLCREGAASLSDDEHYTPRELVFTTTTTSPSDAVDRDGGEEDEEVAAGWVGTEAEYLPRVGYKGRFRARPGHLEPAARLRSVAWILKVVELHQFRPVTAYLAVNYVDRFLSCHALPQQPGGWPVQLLAAACLSLAAKMEETLVPSLLDLQVVEDATFVFEPRTVQRMELLVLDALHWRLSSITPFAFIGFFACKADPSRSHTSYLVSRATRIILATTEEMEFLDHSPSAVAAAAITCAAREAPALSSVSPESAALWCAGLTRDGVVNCYQLMQKLIVGGGQKKQQRHLLTINTSDSVGSDVLSSSPSSSTSSCSSSSGKRRKLNMCRWVDDGMGSRPIEEISDNIN